MLFLSILISNMFRERFKNVTKMYCMLSHYPMQGCYLMNVYMNLDMVESM